MKFVNAALLSLAARSASRETGPKVPRTNPFKSSADAPYSALSHAIASSPSPSTIDPKVVSSRDVGTSETRRLFDECFRRAENLAQTIPREATIPHPLRILYEQAMEIGKSAAMEENHGKVHVALSEYSLSVTLLRHLLLNSTDITDQNVLLQHISIFQRRMEGCSESQDVR